MGGIRVLVGTRKGAFVLTSDGGRADWKVDGPHFAGWEIYHVKGSPADPDRLYASQSSGWFGQVIQRSDDGGRTWEPVGNDFAYDGDARRRTSGTTARRARGSSPGSGTSSRRCTTRTPCTPASRTPRCSRSTDGGADLAGAARPAPARHRPAVAAGRGRHVPAHDHPATRPTRTGSTSPSPRPARSAPTTAARPGSRSTRACGPASIPDQDAEVGHCVHHIAMHPSRPGRAVHAEALGRHAQRRRRRHRGTRSAATCRPTSASRSPCTRTSRTPSTSCRSPATPSTSRRRASCGSTAAAPAATSGRR